MAIKPVPVLDKEGKPKFYKDGTPVMQMPPCPRCGVQVFTYRSWSKPDGSIGDEHLMYRCPECRYEEWKKEAK